MKSYFKFKIWEIFILFLSFVFFFGSITIYFSGISLRKYILGWKEEQGTEEVGKLFQKEGAIRRQLTQAMEFLSIEKNTTLYNFDTLVTSSSGTATLAFNDGGSIQLGPNTMVRLSFESKLSLQGISRFANIEVVTGTVKGQAKAVPMTFKTRDQVITIKPNTVEKQIEVPVAPLVNPIIPKNEPLPPVVAAIAAASPSASPSPLVVEINREVHLITPKNGVHLKVDNESPVPEKTVSLVWDVLPSTHDPVQVVLQKKLGTTQFEDVFRKTSQAKKIMVLIKSPGEYVWQIKNAKGEALSKKETQSTFFIDPEFEAIETLTPLVAGEMTESNAYKGSHQKKFDLTLQWKPYTGAKSYRVKVMDSMNSKKPLMEKTVQQNLFSFNKEKIISGKFYYTVSAELPSGFVVNSKLKEFNFNFLAPALVTPLDQTIITKKDLSEKNGRILLTWQKTNFTEGYELEIAQDTTFTAKTLQLKLKENFFVFKTQVSGKYWWRVRSFSGETISPSSKLLRSKTQ